MRPSVCAAQTNSAFSVLKKSDVRGTVSSFFSQDQHTLLVKYQGLVVKQLVSQNKKSGQGEEPPSDDLDKEQHDITNTTRKELQELSLAIKDLVLKSRKSSVTEE